jgi:hypothetical protein
LASIVSESVMLYGTHSVRWVTGPEEPPRRLETPLASIGHSIEMPRVNIVDPIGLQAMIIQFRTERRPA